MTHGYPPWAGIKRSTIFTLPLDLAEHAVRLGSIDRFDRRGDVSYLTSFAGGLGSWQTSTAGTGATAAVSAQQARSAPYSVKLTGDSGAVYATTLYYNLPYPVLSNIGLELSFTIGANINTVLFSLVIFDGSLRHWPALRFDRPNNKLQYQKGPGIFTDLFTGLGYTPTDYSFHTVKLVVDFVNRKYRRAIFNNRAQALTGIAYPMSASSVWPHVSAGVDLMSVSGANGYSYVDDVIITQNEP